MSSRPTIADIASAAGVSPATVDRVLNARQNVRPETVRQVLDAANRIGYHVSHVMDRRLPVNPPQVRFGFVLRQEHQYFYQLLADEINLAADSLTSARISVDIEYAQAQPPQDAAHRLKQLGERCDAIAATAINHHQTTAAVQQLRTKGIPTFALFSDFAQGEREAYIGTNNLKSGRSAAWMIAKMARKPGNVAIFVGGHQWHGHELRETGFRAFFREYAPEFTVLETLVNLETIELAYEATLDLLERYPDLQGLYIAGGGMEGAIAAVREIRKAEELPLVVTELTPESRAALHDHYITLVTATPLRLLCTQLLEIMVQSTQLDSSAVKGQYLLAPTYHIPESI